MNLRRREIEGVEALVRWNHPERGNIAPDQFVELAEETGHIRPMTEWVIRRSLEDRMKMLDSGADVKISINLSGRLLADIDFIDWVIDELGDGCAGFCLEVTETAVIDDPEVALANIERMRRVGIEISIDDYGSGLSSLSYLKQIPAQELKIDKGFVLGLQARSADSLPIKSTIDLAHSLRMVVTAEGVETNEVLTLLTAMGADIAQGYYIARPMPLSDLLVYLSDRELARFA